MTRIRALALYAMAAWGVSLAGCEFQKEPSSSVAKAVEAIPPESESVSELLTPRGLRASLQERLGDDCEITVHEIAQVDRNGEFAGSRVHGEAVVEIAFADQRLLTMVVLMQYDESKPIRWQDWFNPCAARRQDVRVTNEPTPEALAFFQSECRSVRAMTMAGAVDEPTTFSYGYVDPDVDRVWHVMLERADKSEP